MPDYGQYLKKFATPSIILEAGPDQKPEVFTDPKTGAKTTISPQKSNLANGLAFRNHSVLSLANGATAKILYSQGTGKAFLDGFDRLEREMFRVIILGARSVQEAKHGSKADTGSSMDLFSLAVANLRNPLSFVFRKSVLARYVTLNWGPKIAKQFTPNATFGVEGHINPDLVKVFADAWDKGFFEPEQLPYLWNKVSIPVPPGWTPDDAKDRLDPQQQQDGQENQGGNANPVQAQNPDSGNGQKPNGQSKNQPEPSKPAKTPE